MKYFKLPDGSVFAFDANYEGELITPDMVPMTPQEIEAHLNPAASFAQLKSEKLAKFRADRLAMLGVVSGMGWAALTVGDTATSLTLAAFRQGLLDLPQLPSVTSATDINGLSAAMSTAYKALTDALPAEVKANFKALL